MRPTRWQWVVLWAGVVWIVGSLVLAEEYVVRPVFGGLLVTGLLYWQLSGRGHTHAPKTIDDTSRPSGIGGWLALFWIGLAVLWPITSLIGILNLAGQAGQRSAFLGSVTLVSALAGAAVYVAMGLWHRWPGITRTTLRFFVLMAAVGVLDLVVLAAQGGQSPQIGQAAGRLIWPAIWASYFQRSVRVRNTYSSDATSTPERTPWRLLACGIAALLAFVGIGAHAQASQRVDARAATLTPYELVKGERGLEPAVFDRNYRSSVLRRLEQQGPEVGALSTEPVEVSDLGHTLRTHIEYSGSVAQASDTLPIRTPFRGFIRQYFHAHGIAVVEGNCLPLLADCSDLDALSDTAEHALLLRSDDTGLDGVLPDGECSIESDPLPALPTEMAATVTCTYGDGGLTLMLARSDAARFDRVMDASGRKSPQMRRAIAAALLASSR